MDAGQGAAQATAAGVAANGAGAEPYIVRTGPVRLSTELLMPVAPTYGLRRAAPEGLPGRRLGLRFFDDRRHEVLVTDASRVSADTLAVRGQAAELPLASFTLTVDQESYLMTLQDLTASRLYRAVGDTDTGTGRVTEIDLTKIPPAVCGPPLAVPAQAR